MKIGIIAGTYKDSKDGIGRYTSNLVWSIQSKGGSLYFDTSENKKSFQLSSQKNRKFKYVVPNIFNTFLTSILLELNYLSKFVSKYKENKTLQVLDADIFHAVSISETIQAVRLKKKPLVTTIHDIIPLVSENRFLLEKVYFKYFINSARKSELILADSKHTKEDIIRVLKVPSSKIKVLYPAIDTTKFYPLKNAHKKSTVTKILYLGGLNKRKGIYEIIYAFKDILAVRKDVKLIIGGHGEEKEKVKSLIKKLHLTTSVSLLGFISEDRMLKTYHQADIFVYPSKYEGFGYTPLEAMASGIPVITSNLSSIPEVVGDAAILVNPYNSKEIGDKILYLLDDSKLQKRMIKKGLKQANKFSKENFSIALNKIYKQLI